jgi:multidrug efflux pump subunit AcrA (membrane-fusion protein)
LWWTLPATIAVLIAIAWVVGEVRATGHVDAVTTVQVGAEVSGRIATVEIDYHARVKAGQELARFDRTASDGTFSQVRRMISPCAIRARSKHCCRR